MLLNNSLDAQWYTREQVLSVLRHPIGGNFGKAEYKKMAESTEERDNTKPQLDPSLDTKGAKAMDPPSGMTDEPPFRLPPVTAIAGVLIRDWVDGAIGFPQSTPQGTLYPIPKPGL